MRRHRHSGRAPSDEHIRSAVWWAMVRSPVRDVAAFRCTNRWRVPKAAHFSPKRGTQIPPFDEWERSSNEHIVWFMKIEARAWAADASLNEDISHYDVPRRYFAGHRRRWASWGRAVGRHGPSLWLAAVVLVLSLSWVKACTSTPAQAPSSLRYHSRGYYAHPRVTRAMISAMWHRRATDESVR